MERVVRGTEEALSGLRDGMTVALGGEPPRPLPGCLLAGVGRSDARGLRLLCSHAALTDPDVVRLLGSGRVARVVAVCPDHAPGGPGHFPGEPPVPLERLPFGESVERLRAAAAGVPRFYLPVVSSGGDRPRPGGGAALLRFAGRIYVRAPALRCDVALLRGRADAEGRVRLDQGNELWRAMGRAAALTVVESTAEHTPHRFPDEEADLPPGTARRVLVTSRHHRMIR
jgi:acyl CoA:acetate/3-ketoacid CoA transferase alpha subunit